MTISQGAAMRGIGMEAVVKALEDNGFTVVGNHTKSGEPSSKIQETPVTDTTQQIKSLLQRNLIYTAVTRAKKVCIVIGQKRALWYAVSHVTVTQRNTKLKERLQGKTVLMTYIQHDDETETYMAAENKFE